MGTRNDRRSREQRMKEANERNSRWASLTPQQQLAELDRRGVAATKQRAKIAKLLK